MLSLGHGIGVDHDLPTLYRTETAEIEPGHVISVHPYYTDASRGIFGGVADAFHVTETRAEQLSSLPHKLTVL
jgi:Xaa-Pro aminopeptidase